MRTLSLCLALLAPLAALADAAGQRVQIDVPANAAAPEPRAVVDALLGGQKGGLVRVQVMRGDGGGTSLRLDLAGIALPADIAGALRAAFPALQNAQIEVTALDASALPAAPDVSDPAALKKQLEEQLAAEGKTGTVDVQVEESAGTKKVEVKVQATQEQ